MGVDSMTMDSHGLQSHCPVLFLHLQDLYVDVFRKIPADRRIVDLSDLLSTCSCSILCRRSVMWFILSGLNDYLKVFSHDF